MNGEKIIIRDPRGVEFSLLCPDFERIPRYLKRHAVWMLTKGEWDGDSFKKEPYTIGYHKRASWQRWSNHHSFEAVKAEYECGGYIGVVFVLTKKARVVCIDIDHAFEADDITYLPKVQEIVDMFPNTYIERSLRGKGIHIFALGTAPSGKSRKDLGIELYPHSRYIAVTGHALNQFDITDGQDAINRLYTMLCTKDMKIGKKVCSKKRSYIPPVYVPNLTWKDLDLIRGIRESIDSLKFEILFAGDVQAFYDYMEWQKGNSINDAELSFMNLLAFWTSKDRLQMDRIYRNSGLMREKWDSKRGDGTYGSQLIDEACSLVENFYKPEGILVEERPKEIEKNSNHATILQENQENLERITKEHFATKNSILVIPSAPGTGKTTTITETIRKEKLEVDVVVGRHDQIAQIPALQDEQIYVHIMPCTEHNCIDWAIHNILVKLGISVKQLHRNHTCEYWKQWNDPRNKIYQHIHLENGVAGKHASFIDDMSLSSHTHKSMLNAKQLHDLMEEYEDDQILYRFISSIYLLVSHGIKDQVDHKKNTITGKSLYDLLKKQTPTIGFLMERVGAHPEILKHQASAKSFNIDPENDEELKHKKYQTILTMLYHAFKEDRKHWGKKEWNSCTRLEIHKDVPKLILLRPTNLRHLIGNPHIYGSATVNMKFLQLLHEELEFELYEQHTPLAKGTKHYHYHRHYGKQYVEKAIKDGGRDLDRFIGVLRAIVNRFDPTKELRKNRLFGFITYKFCAKFFAELLEIPEGCYGWFGGIAGSNRLLECKVGLVFGTHTYPNCTIFQQARLIHRNDPEPIIEEMHQDPKTLRWKYVDPRCQEINDTISNDELRQSAHRIRPVRYEDRIIITLSDAEISDIPVTHDFTVGKVDINGNILTETRRDRSFKKIEQAIVELTGRGEAPTQRNICQLVHVSPKTVTAWNKDQKRLEEAKKEVISECLREVTLYSVRESKRRKDRDTHTHTHRSYENNMTSIGNIEADSIEISSKEPENAPLLT